MSSEYVVLVDENDAQIGTMEKMQAHLEGKLHRAVSVILFNSQKQMLLQKRADGKYHSAGLWSNACCSHPRPGENSLDAAKRRLYEEMGIRCELQKMFEVSYNLKLDKNLREHEFDHVYAGISNDIPLPDPSEVSDWRYANVAQIKQEIKEDPLRFTEWFILIMDRLN